MKKLTFERANELLRYDPENGLLFWKVPRQGAKVGAFAGSMNGRCQYVRIDGYSYTAACIVWLLNTGEWPEGKIQFISGDRRDTRYENLHVDSKLKPAPEPKPTPEPEPLESIWSKSRGSKKRPLTIDDLRPKPEPGKKYAARVNIPGVTEPFAVLESDKSDTIAFAIEKANELVHELAYCPAEVIQHRLAYLRAYLKRVDEKPNSRPVQKLFKTRFQQLCKPPEK